MQILSKKGKAFVNHAKIAGFPEIQFSDFGELIQSINLKVNSLQFKFEEIPQGKKNGEKGE